MARTKGAKDLKPRKYTGNDHNFTEQSENKLRNLAIIRAHKKVLEFLNS